MKKKLVNIAIVICSFIAIGIDSCIFYELYDSKRIFLTVGKEVLRLDFIGSLVLFILLYFLFSKYRKKGNLVINLLSVIFSLFMIFGNSYMNYGNQSLVFGKFILFILAVLSFIGYFFLFQIGLDYLYLWFDKKKNKKLQ